MNRIIPSKEIGKTLGRGLIGALVGAGAATLFIGLLGKPDLGERDLSTLIAIVAGLCFALMGLMVFIGTLAPAAGAHFLNVEDAEDIREQRPTLAPSALSMVLIGAIFLILALASSPASPGLLPAAWAAGIAGACLVAVIGVHLRTRDRSDELIRQVSMEASALAMHIALVIALIWAASATLGFAEPLSALGLAAALALLELFAIFWVCGRKGLLSQPAQDQKFSRS